MKYISLTKEELKELKGGNQTSLSSTIDEVKNINEVAKCKCEYKNKAHLINSNKVDGCKCSCN